MRHLYLLVPLFLFLICTSCEQNEQVVDTSSDLFKDNVKGNVLKTKVKRFYAKDVFGEISYSNSDLNTVEVVTYNDDGYILTMCTYNKEGEENEKYIYVYDEDNLILEEKSYKKGKLLSTTKNVIKDKKIVQDESVYTDGQEKKNTKFDFEKESVKPSNANSIQGEKTTIITYEYFDEYGSQRRTRISGGDTAILETRYNNNFRPVYLSFKMSLKEIAYTDENTSVFEYDTSGDLITIKNTNYVQKYEYKEYDDKKNWTKRYIYQDDKIKSVEEREITYK